MTLRMLFLNARNIFTVNKIIMYDCYLAVNTISNISTMNTIIHSFEFRIILFYNLSY